MCTNKSDRDRAHHCRHTTTLRMSDDVEKDTPAPIYGFSPKQVAEYRVAFSEFDTDGALIAAFVVVSTSHALLCRDAQATVTPM